MKTIYIFASIFLALLPSISLGQAFPKQHIQGSHQSHAQGAAGIW